MKSFSRSIIITLLALIPMLQSCGGKEDIGDGNLNFIITLPSSLDVVSGREVSLGFLSGKGPSAGDVVILKNGGRQFESPVTAVTDDRFTFVIPEGLTSSGVYEFSIRRGAQVKDIGRLTLKVTSSVFADLKPAEGATIYGVVHCGGKGLAGVEVTDGYELVLTDRDGVYQLPSLKKNAMVYITLPSGYTAVRNGVQPQFWQKLTGPGSVPERKDFDLVEDGDQTNHTMLVFGDMHLANRTDDRAQFATFTKEVESYASRHKGEKLYAVTLGDMCWDTYWYSQKYGFPNYLNDINSVVKSIPVFHTIGNHDHDMKTSVSGASEGWDAVDWDTAMAFRKDIGPNYYSFNIGAVHYIVLDNIYCMNTTGGTSSDRHYENTIGTECLDWLKRDLVHVDKSTTVVVAMHAPMYSQTGGSSLDNCSTLAACFSGFGHVRFITGHSHKMWNVDKGAIKEHNSGAICAAWWWAGHYNPTLNIAQDGSPSGYRVMEFKGGKYNSYYKAVGRPEDYQFRSYDRNQIRIVPADLGVTTYAADFDKYLASHGGYGGGNASNDIIINVWDWDTGWSISVTEGGKALTVTPVQTYDPLYLIAYSAYRYKSTASPTYDVSSTNHMFKVRAGSATSTVVIKVTDDEGRVYTETMARPKAFAIATYK